MKKKYLLQQNQCECSLIEFYRNAAKIMGEKVTSSTQYDCRKICITKEVQNSIWKCYTETGYGNEDISTILLLCGPKAILSDDVYGFEVESGFIVDGE